MISVILQAGSFLGSHWERQTVFRGSVAGKKKEKKMVRGKENDKKTWKKKTVKKL